MIAGHALTTRSVIVINNKTEFFRVLDLVTEDWSQG
jgi:predicted nucleic acid-binding protein